jgi:hypothetical protein
VCHGFIFFWTLKWLVPKGTFGFRLAIAAGIEASWEVLENTALIIERYVDQTASFSYKGDSIINSAADLSAAIASFALASRCSLLASVAILVSLELLSVWICRDSLVINVITLTVDSELIKNWQAGALQ